MSKAKKEVNSEIPIEDCKYPIEKLRKGCLQLFRVTPSTFDGVTCNLQGEFTISEMRELIGKWNKKKVLAPETEEV